MRIRTLVALITPALALLAVGLWSPAEAGFTPEVNGFTVEKVVDGPVPEGAVFEVEVTCTSIFNSAPTADPGPTTVKFDATGAPLTENTILAEAGYECTAVETVTNGATVSYACEATAPVNGAEPEQPGNDFVPVQCTDDQTVVFDDILGAQGTVTVTNTFEPEPEPEPEPEAAPAGVVAARPTFTG
jgi:hypothetical protein